MVPATSSIPGGNEWNDDLCRKDKRGTENTVTVYSYPLGISGYGLHNTSGNVWELCRDWYDEDYFMKSPRENPEGPSEGS